MAGVYENFFFMQSACMHLQCIYLYINIYLYNFISVCVTGFVCFIVSCARMHVCMYVCMPGCMSMQTCQWNCCILRPGASQAHENVALEVRRSDEPPFATELSLRSHWENGRDMMGMEYISLNIYTLSTYTCVGQTINGGTFPVLIHF